MGTDTQQASVGFLGFATVGYVFEPNLLSSGAPTMMTIT